MKLDGWLIELLRIIIAAPIGWWAVESLRLSTALNILLLFLIYMLVALAIEAIRKALSRKR